MHTLNTLHSIPSASRRGRFLLFLLILLLLFDEPLCADGLSNELGGMVNIIRGQFLGKVQADMVSDAYNWAAISTADTIISNMVGDDWAIALFSGLLGVITDLLGGTILGKAITASCGQRCLQGVP